jgi:hypothetical protein
MNTSMKTRLAPSTFCADLIEQNGISDFSQWFFYSGMLFGSDEKWWGKGGERPEPHEGLDICYYKNKAQSLCKLDGQIKVPVMPIQAR